MQSLSFVSVNDQSFGHFLSFEFPNNKNAYNNTAATLSPMAENTSKKQKASAESFSIDMASFLSNNKKMMQEQDNKMMKNTQDLLLMMRQSP